MSFFSRLLRYNRWLFRLICVFCILAILVNFSKVETTPFFVWGMYSEKEADTGKYDILEVIVNDSIRLDYSASFMDANRFYLLSPLSYAWRIKQNGGVDPAERFLRDRTGRYFSYITPFKEYLFNDSNDLASFQNWYKKYLEGSLHIPVNDVHFNVLELVYNGEGRPELVRKLPLVLWNH